jgi:thymidylate synthase
MIYKKYTIMEVTRNKETSYSVCSICQNVNDVKRFNCSGCGSQILAGTPLNITNKISNNFNESMLSKLKYAQYQEKPYMKLCIKIMQENEIRDDRTGTQTISLFGSCMKFSMLDGVLPVITTKKVWLSKIIKELLWFISGKTDTKILENDNVKIWKKHTSSEYLKLRNLDYKEGDAGPIYGFQWRHWGAKYLGCDHDYTGQGIDQLMNIIDGIKNDPYSRRHVLSSWNVADLDLMALPPCHCFVQFYVSTCGNYLDCSLYQRSCDMFLGVPFNITSYCLLTYIIGHLTNKVPRNFIHMLGDAHIYTNHISQVKTQLIRTPYDFPSLTIKNNPQSLEDFNYQSFEIKNYKHHPEIKGDMAI